MSVVLIFGQNNASRTQHWIISLEPSKDCMPRSLVLQINLNCSYTLLLSRILGSLFDGLLYERWNGHARSLCLVYVQNQYAGFFDWPVSFTGMLTAQDILTLCHTSETVPIYCKHCSAHAGLYWFFAYACEGMLRMRPCQVKLIVYSRGWHRF